MTPAAAVATTIALPPSIRAHATVAPNKIQTNLRLTPRARRILDMLSRRWGVSQADVMELLLRQAVDQPIPAPEKGGAPPSPSSDPGRYPYRG